MFTGIISATGKVVSFYKQNNKAKISIKSETLDFSLVKIGDSIATNGVCLTVTKLDKNCFSADVSFETLDKSNFGFLNSGDLVNLENSLTLNTLLGGHLVLGHVDTKAKVTKLIKKDDILEIFVLAPDKFLKYITYKGSICLDGISLTINEIINKNTIKLTIVKHTAMKTNIKFWQVGYLVNLEVDLIARYLEKLMDNKQTKLTKEKIKLFGLS